MPTTANLRARDIMTADPVCVVPSTRLRELARVFEEHEISGAPVLDHDGRVVGVVSRSDVFRRCSDADGDVPPAYLFEALSDKADGDQAREVIPEPLICVEDLMTPSPIMVRPDALATEVARLMVESRIHRVIVADEEKFPVGIITTMDLLDAYSNT